MHPIYLFLHTSTQTLRIYNEDMTHKEGSKGEVLLLHITVGAGVCTQEIKELTHSPVFL